MTEKFYEDLSNIKYLSMLTCFMFLLRPTILLVFYGLPYYFSIILRAAGRTIMRVCTLAHCTCAAQVCSHLNFFKLTDM